MPNKILKTVKITIAALLLVCVTTGSLMAGDNTVAITSSELRVRTRIVEAGGKQLLFLKLVNRLNGRPNRPCAVRLAGFVSRIGDSGVEAEKQILSSVKIPRNSRKRVRYKYYGDSINGNINKQWQGNFQVRVKCRNREPIYSNTLATNLTCRGGVRSNTFVPLLRNGLLVD